MKNIHGFYQHSSAGPLNVVRFLTENTLGFARRYGIPSTDADVNVEKLGKANPVLVGMKGKPLTAGGKAIGPEKKLVVRFNADAILEGLKRGINAPPPILQIPYLWSLVGSGLRFFSVYFLPIAEEELLPAMLLEKLGLPELKSEIGRQYVERNLTVRDTKIMTDNAVTSAYFMRLMSVRAKTDTDVSIDDIGKAIFESRRSNWETTLQKIE